MLPHRDRPLSRMGGYRQGHAPSPQGLAVSVKDFPLINTKATVDMETAYPVDNTQSMTLTLHGEIPAQALRVRFGPFTSESDTVEPDTPAPDTDAPTEPAESDTTSRMARFC